MAEACKFKIGAYWLIPLESANAEELADYQLRNKDRIAPFSPKRTDTFYSSAYWRSSKRRAAKERREETAFRWVLEQDGLCSGANQYGSGRARRLPIRHARLFSG